MQILKSIRNVLGKLYIPLYVRVLLIVYALHVPVSFLEQYAGFAGFNWNTTSTEFLAGKHPVDAAAPQVNSREKSTGPGLKFTIKDTTFSSSNVIPDRSKDIQARYPLYRLVKLQYLFVPLIAFWLWPVYRFNFLGQKKYTTLVETRIVTLGYAITVLIWCIGLYDLVIKTVFYGLYDGVFWSKPFG
jgi:hypothetical protein